MTKAGSSNQRTGNTQNVHSVFVLLDEMPSGDGPHNHMNILYDITAPHTDR